MFLLYLVTVLLLLQFICTRWTCANITQANTWAWAKIIPPLSVALFAVFMVLSRKYQTGVGDVLAFIAYVWLGFAFIWFCAVMVAMALHLGAIALKLNWLPNMGWYVLAISIALSGFSLFNGLSKPKIKHVTLNYPQISESLKIAQISDSHLGRGLAPKRLKSVADDINKINPDIIVFTGDILEDTGDNEQSYIDILNTLNPKFGKYGVLGNHEYYGNANYNLAIWQKAGIKPLLNTSVQVGGITITGINDVRTTNIDAQQFTAIIKQNKGPGFNLLLSHTPLYFDEAAQNGTNLMLSGHTHNGQIWPFKYLAGLQFKHVYGLHRVGDAAIYVTSGTFYWGPPMRLFTKNEVPLFTLTKNEN